MFAGKAGALQVLHSRVGSWPRPQTIDWSGKASQEQTLLLITKILNLWPYKICITLALGACTVKLYYGRDLFQLSLIFEGKGAAYPSGAPYGNPLK